MVTFANAVRSTDAVALECKICSPSPVAENTRGVNDPCSISQTRSS